MRKSVIRLLAILLILPATAHATCVCYCDPIGKFTRPVCETDLVDIYCPPVQCGVQQFAPAVELSRSSTPIVSDEWLEWITNLGDCKKLEREAGIPCQME